MALGNKKCFSKYTWLEREREREREREGGRERSVLGGYSWAREAQHKKRRVDISPYL